MFRYQIDAEAELRLLELQHLQQFFGLAHGSRRHIGEWMFWIDEDYTLEDARRQIRQSLDRFVANDGFDAGIWFRGELAGCIRYRYIDWKHKNTELGYWLGSSFQGHGLVAKSCAALIDYAFGELRLHRVEIRCMSENVRSRRIPERLGFVQEGIVRQVRWKRDHYDDHIVYGMLADEWRARK